MTSLNKWFRNAIARLDTRAKLLQVMVPLALIIVIIAGQAVRALAAGDAFSTNRQAFFIASTAELASEVGVHRGMLSPLGSTSDSARLYASYPPGTFSSCVAPNCITGQQSIQWIQVGAVVPWESLQGIPSTFAPAAHGSTHTATDPVTIVNSNIATTAAVAVSKLAPASSASDFVLYSNGIENRWETYGNAGIAALDDIRFTQVNGISAPASIASADVGKLFCVRFEVTA